MYEKNTIKKIVQWCYFKCIWNVFDA